MYLRLELGADSIGETRAILLPIGRGDSLFGALTLPISLGSALLRAAPPWQVHTSSILVFILALLRQQAEDRLAETPVRGL